MVATPASVATMAMAGPAVEGVAVVGEDEGGAELEGVQELQGQGGSRGGVGGRSWREQEGQRGQGKGGEGEGGRGGVKIG